ncbi:MAG TPA: VWA domain-containing protein, partial [Candidatus Ozemobacteraceae bacterium]|nr:VWA domain-containing protein [Candidatus Ozemobacteraceae bacterium]
MSVFRVARSIALLLFCLFSCPSWNNPLLAQTEVVPPPIPAEVTLGPTEEKSFSFFHPGGVFRGLKISPASGTLVDCRMSGRFTQGAFDLDAQAERQVEGTAGPFSLFDGIPQHPGTYTLTLTNATDSATRLRIETIDLGPLPRIEPDGRSGTLIVKKAATSGIRVRPESPGVSAWGENGFSTDTPKGDLTPAGDVVMSVPAGLWRLAGTIGSLGIDIESHFVPILPGKTTIVENWPVLDQKELKGAESTVGGLRLRNVGMDGEHVKVRFSTPDLKGTVDKKDLEVFEGGMPGEVLSVKRAEEPLQLVVLLDSSGSMKNDLKKVITAAEVFFRNLPKGTGVNLIDFDTQPKLLKTSTAEDALKALKGFKADGATALNDSVILGLKHCHGDRSALVLFTDGFDANHNDTGPGSKAAPEEMFEVVKQAGIPVFTIGYGKKPDESTLRRLATLSGGAYFRAQADTVQKVFDQLNGILGRDFELVYRRPGITAPSDVPVVCVMLDRSGSMNMSPIEEGCGYRMEEAKGILRRFIEVLPDNAVVQIADFHQYITIQQAWTTNRQAMLRGISQIFSYGGTEIVGALDVAFRSLRQMPSRRRYLLFITDLGLPGLDDEPFRELAGMVKDAGIHCTWVGMVDPSKRAPFDEVASFTGGTAAVANDPTSLREAAERLGKQINADKTVDPRLEVRLTLARKDETGNPLVMSAADLFPLPPSPQTATASVHGIRYVITDEARQNTAGLWKAGHTTELTAEAANKAFRIRALELKVLDEIGGMKPPSDERFIALRLRFECSSPTALIDNLRAHLFLKWNENPETGASPLTWLGEDPLVQPDNEGLALRSGNPVEGHVVFRVPDEGASQVG